jgi:putative ABC transport system permease protein
MPIFKLALKSILNRKFTATLTVLSIALSVTMLLGVERLRTEARTSFANTISGTDLVVGARSGAVPLLLYSVFRIGNATNNISWESYRDIARHPRVVWTVPISLGDSHRGFRVMGTSPDYFRHYRFARTRSLAFSEGRVFDDVYDAVLGADVARELGYRLDQRIVIAHGAGKVSFVQHDDKPFRVVGILRKTGTPVDRTVHVSLAGIEAIHIDWQGGGPAPGLKVSADEARRLDLTPKAITAFFVGLSSKISTFHVQRFINEYKEEPLLAILPGVALQELWDLMSVAEKALMAISAFVVLVGLTGMLTVILTSLNERRREMAILRSVGARPWHIFTLIMGEAGVLTLIGVAIGVVLLYGLLLLAQPLVENQFGLFIAVDWPSSYELGLLAVVLIAGLLTGSVPAYRAYRYSLADGMTIRI